MEESTFTASKRVVRSSRGMVAAKHPFAAEAGAAVLREGGNAVDAAVTTAFVVGVVEPHMNGIGGGGYLTLHDQGTGHAAIVDYSMRAPKAASPTMFELEEGIDPEAFGWRRVRGFANRVGQRAVAVPGTLAGLAVALRRFGTISLQRALQPAIEAAETGFPIGWYEAVYRGMQADELARDPIARRIFLESDVILPDTTHVLRQPELAATLRQIATQGPETLYGGELGARVAQASQERGGLLREEDFADYEVSVQQSGVLGSYRDLDVIGRRAGTGSPSLVQLLQLLQHFDLRALKHGSPDYLHVYLEAAQRVQADRLTFLADPERQRVPLTGLLSPAYAHLRAQEIDPNGHASQVHRGDPWAFDGAPSVAPPRTADAEAGGSTTALVAVDGNGVAVSITQTLMSAWGSCVVAGDTGILLNNGMLWFNPEPGHPNSVQGGQRGLNNMCPVVLRRRTGLGPRTVLAVSASGGRRITHAIAQVILGVVDFGMDPQEAIAAPRVDASTLVATIDPRFGAATLSALHERGHRFTVVPDALYPRAYASPVAIAVRGEELLGGVDVFHPAVAVGL